MHDRWVTLSSDELDELDTRVHRIDGEERLNRPFEYRLEVSVGTRRDIRELVARLLENPLTLRFEDGREVVRRVHGVVCELDFELDLEIDRTHLRLTLVPRTWQLTQRYGAEIFVARTIPQIIQEKLERIGLVRERDFVFALHHDYPTREIVVQYEETDHDFVSRWCEHEGIVTFFEHRNGRDVLLLADDAPPYGRLRVDVLNESLRREHASVYNVRTSVRRKAATTRIHDYNYRSPRLALNDVAAVARSVVRRAGEGTSEDVWVDYGAHTKDPAETRRIARVRSEAMGVDAEVVRGGITELSAHPGACFTLTSDEVSNRALLTTAVTIRGRSGDDASLEVAFEAIPQATPYRPQRVIPRPKIAGLLNARIDGNIKGDYAELDESGRYHVQMTLDRSGRTALTASHPVRMMQPHSGSHYGMHFPLRPGAEVLLGFVDGNPDRPVIVGTAPNPETSSPVVRANQTQNVLRTGSNNEVVIEDQHDIERIRIHTPKHNTTFQLGSVEEPEAGALLTTQASVSHAARHSFNVAATRATTLTSAASHIAGDSVYVLTGVAPAVDAASRGIEVPSSVDMGAMERGFGLLMRPLGADVQESMEEASEDLGVGTPLGGLWSGLSESLHTLTEDTAFAAVRAMAVAADELASRGLGRSQGQPLGAPLKPAFVAGSPETSALFSRNTAFVFGDRVASLASFDSASVVGQNHAEVKSPGTVEVASGGRALISAGDELDGVGRTVRLVGGYYPQANAPPLDEGTSVGVMSRADLRIVSVEDCVLVCAHKNLIGSAHTGDIRLTAEGAVAIRSASIVATTGDITVDASGDIRIKAANIVVECENLDIEAHGRTRVSTSHLTVENSTTICGDLNVTGRVTAAEGHFPK